jgi:hypothetical protein
MFGDNSLSFNTNLSSTQAITATAASTTVIDVTGAGAGNAPNQINGYGQANTAIGVDYGTGDGMATPYVVVLVTAVTTVTGTLTIALQAAPDNGSYSAGTYTSIFTSAALTGATQLYAGAVLYFQVPPTLAAMGEALPRFYRLNYTVGSSISLSVNAFMTLNAPSFAGTKAGLLGGQYNSNFVAV